MDQSRSQFVAETEDLIEQVLADLDELREHDEHTAPPDLVDRLFRRIHRVKGSAASFGFNSLSDIAHEFESLLSAVRGRRAPLNDELLDTCERAAAALAETLALTSFGAIAPQRRALFERMQSLARDTRGELEHNIDGIPIEIPFEFRQSLSDDEKHQLQQAATKGARLFVLTASFDTIDFDDQFRKLKKTLQRLGEVIATSPTLNTERTDEIDFRMLFTSEADPGELSSHLANFTRLKLMTLKREIAQLPEDESDQNSMAGLPPKSASSFANVIRMDADDLDRLISSTHELFRITNAALDLAQTQTSADGPALTEINQLAAQIERSFLAIEKDLIDLRMVSVGATLRRAVRAGRAAARLSNKKIEFRILGDELRLDRILCDAIADPLIHLVRNAVDHGVETPDSGVASARTKRPIICVEAVREGRQTCIRVTDNGRGVDPELVSKAAISLGIIDQDTRVDMERSLRLIFRPGFTTQSSVSTVSGRGFGLDVVESGVEQVGGELRVSSVPGQGSTFEIRLPVTIGLVKATVVSSGEYFYCIDSEQILRTEKVDAGEVEFNDERKPLKPYNEALPVVHLKRLLGQAMGPTSEDQLQVLVCQLSGNETTPGAQVRIIVDGIKGTEEVLARNLGRHAARWTGVAGATELRDGTVALVLDLPRLLRGADLSL